LIIDERMSPTTAKEIVKVRLMICIIKLLINWFS
jgi:hypothetical protein